MHTLYEGPTARVKINRDLADSFKLERETRQGCPISPLLFALFIEPLGRLIRQNKSIKRITVAGTEQKVALFMDNVLVFMEEPKESFVGLMALLADFGKLSGYKLNISKTQVMTVNFTAPKSMKEKYNLQWKAKSIKYLGINLTKDLSKLSQANYDPLSLKIETYIYKWNLVPFLNFNSRISAVKTNILPRLLYIFRTLPIEVSGNQFREWDK